MRKHILLFVIHYHSSLKKERLEVKKKQSGNTIHGGDRITTSPRSPISSVVFPSPRDSTFEFSAQDLPRLVP